VVKKLPVSSTFAQPFLFFLFLVIFLLFLMSSSIWLNCLVLSHLMGLFLLKFISNALLGILVLFILFTWPNHYSHFYSSSVNKLLDSIFSKDFISNSVPSSFTLGTYQQFCIPYLDLVLFLNLRFHVSALNGRTVTEYTS
jgi:hypothetical protein